MTIKFNILLVFLAFVIIAVISCCVNKESFTDEEQKELIPTVKRPYVNLYDNNGNKLNIVGISKPFSVDKEYEDYTNNKDKLIFIGLYSYLEFPNPVSNPFENFDDNYKKYKYKEICRAWLHGFRNPIDYFPPGVPESLISESDFADCSILKPDPSVEKKYDFLYICLKQDEKKDEKISGKKGVSMETVESYICHGKTISGNMFPLVRPIYDILVPLRHCDLARSLFDGADARYKNLARLIHVRLGV